MEPLYVHLAIWLFPVSKPNIQIQIETPFGKWQFHGSFSKYCELCSFESVPNSGLFSIDSFSDDSHPRVLFCGIRPPHCVRQILFDRVATRRALRALFHPSSSVETVLPQGTHSRRSDQWKDGEWRHHRRLRRRRPNNSRGGGKRWLRLFEEDPLLRSLRPSPSSSRC